MPDETDNFIDYLLRDSLTDSDRLDKWRQQVEELPWEDGDSADACVEKGFELLKAWGLTPATKIGKGKNAATARSILLRHYGRLKPLVVSGPDGKPVGTEAGKFFVSTLAKHFEPGQVAAALPDESRDTRPEWEVPVESVNGPAKELFTIMGAAQFLQAEQGTPPRFYLRQRQLVEVIWCEEGHPGIEAIGPDRLPTIMELFVRPFRMKEKVGRSYTVPTPVQCRMLLNCREQMERLPMLRVLANAPVIVADGNQPRIITGYDSATGTLVTGGGKVETDMSLEDAVSVIEEVIDEFAWASEADHSRAIASYLTPAMLNGGHLGGRPPVDVAEADESRAGKAYRQDLIALAYRECFTEIGQSDRTGTLEDQFDGALIQGGTWLRFDNFRGALNSPKIESFTTQNSYTARSAYTRVTKIDPRRHQLWITSNGMDMTEDMVNRSLIVRIRHREGCQFQDKKSMVEQGQPFVLGAILRVVAEWISAGKPRTNEMRHDFTWWCQPVDYMVRNFFKLPPIMDGHEELKVRVSSAVQTWLRLVAQAVRHEVRLGQSLAASEIAEICLDHGVEIPRMPRNGTLMQAAQAVGAVMAKAFASRESITVEDFVVSREEIERDVHVHHNSKNYVFEIRQ